jgi:hypothetical protein
MTTPHDDHLQMSTGEESGRALISSPFNAASRQNAPDHREVICACFHELIQQSGRLLTLLPVRLGLIAETPPKWPISARIRSSTRCCLTGMRCGRERPKGLTFSPFPVPSVTSGS